MNTLAFVVVFLAAVLVSPCVAAAQPSGKIHRIGLLGATSAEGYAPQLQALRQGLRNLGYVEGRNLLIEYRWAEGRYERLAGLAAELVGRKVEVIVTHGTPGSQAAKAATGTIPIVMAIVGDAVAAGIVDSLARPGGNITGSSFFFPELMAKRLEVLREAVPRMTRVAVLLNPDNPSIPLVLTAMEAAARSLRLELQRIEVRRPGDFDGAFAEMARRRADAFVVADDGMLITHARAVAALGAKARLPSIGFAEFVEGGGLMAYAVNFPKIWRRSAVFIDKILKGARPANLPIEQASTFEMILNARAAKALGVNLPQPLLLRADRLIQ